MLCLGRIANLAAPKTAGIPISDYLYADTQYIAKRYMCEKKTHIRCKYYLKNAKSHISVAGFKRIRLKMILEEKDNYLRLYSKHIF